MKNIGIALLSAALVMGAACHGIAQNAVQTLSFTLVAYDQPTPTTTRQVRFTSKDIIRYFIGTNVSGGQLLLVTPIASGAQTNTGNMNAFLRIVKGNTTLMEVPTPDSFNFFQDGVSTSSRGGVVTSFATDRFSIDFQEFHAELQGFTTWSSGRQTHIVVLGSPLILTKPSNPAVSGIGSFSSTLSGTGTIDEVTQFGVPIQGTVTGGTPKLE